MSDNTSHPTEPENQGSPLPLANDGKIPQGNQESPKTRITIVLVVLVGLIGGIVGFLADLFSIIPSKDIVCNVVNLPGLCSDNPCENVSNSSADCALKLFASQETDPNIPAPLQIETLREIEEDLQLTSSFHVGEYMKVRFTSTHSGYVFLFNINPDGALVTFFPNQYSEIQQGYIKAGQTLTIPDIFWEFDFPVKEPIGRGTLIAVLIKDEDVDELAIGHNVLPLVAKKVVAQDAKALLQILHQQLVELTVADGPREDRPVQWFSSMVNYDIML